MKKFNLIFINLLLIFMPTFSAEPNNIIKVVKAVYKSDLLYEIQTHISKNKYAYCVITVIGAYGLYKKFFITNSSNFGIAQMQGRRSHMEDAYDIKINQDHQFYGIFDGHGGRLVSDEVAHNLYSNIINNSDFALNKSKAIIEGYKKTDKELDINLNKQGTTAVIAIIESGVLYVGNAGDSRAVLSYNGVANALSVDHKPNRPDEKERISKLGGEVIFYGCWRVQGILAMTRALGDKSLNPYVISTPEITIHPIEKTDEFLILACDGVWDVLSNQEAVDIVRNSLNINNDYQHACQKLIDFAYSKGSMDNISAIVVNLKNKCIKS